MAEGLNKYELNALLKGPCSWLWAPAGTTVANLADLFDPDGEPYAPETPFKFFGATTSGSAYSRQFATAGYQIEQASGNVDEEVTDAVRTIQGNFGQITPELLQMMEQAQNIDTVAKAKGRSAEKQVRFGTVESLEEYVLAIVGRRLKGKGADVVESGGAKRGAFAAAVFLAGKITGDQAAINLAKGQLSSAALSFQAYSDDSQEHGEEHGLWIVEEPGTIEAAE